MDIEALWDYENPGESERRFRSALEKAENISLSDRIELMTQMARAQGLQSRFADAHATLAEAIALLHGEKSAAKVRWLLEKGRVHNSAGELAAAGELFLAAWNMARELGADNLAVDAAHMLGICLPPAEGMEWNRRALELAESSRDAGARRWKASLLNNMGWTSMDCGDYSAALDFYQLALAARIERKQPKQILIARWCVARALRSLGRVAEALAMQEALACEHLAAGTSDPLVNEELAECRRLLASGNR